MTVFSVPAATTAPDPQGFATCPTCHTADAAMTNDAISKGADWNCTRCGQLWNARRLATAGSYAAWASRLNDAHMKRREASKPRGDV